MKNISLLLNLILIPAVAFLYFKVYSGDSSTPASLAPMASGGTRMVFVNSDSLLEKYTYFNDMKKAMEQKRDSIDKMLTGRGEALERDIAKYRETGASLSPAERSGREQTLMARQQELMELRDKMLEGLGEDEKKINESLQSNLLTFLKEYNSKHGYDFILGYQPGGGILFANDSLDVTLDVVKGLNSFESK